MFNQPIASILAIGTELVEGIIQDNHGRYLAANLHDIGILVKEIVLVADDIEIADRLSKLANDHDLVIVCGGLGPTSDDITREVVAKVAGVELIFCEDIWKELENRFTVKVSLANRKQAYIPEGADLLVNPWGTAPGFIIEVPSGCHKNKKNSFRSLICALPGPTRELQPMFEKEVKPKLIERFGLHDHKNTVASCFLISESRLEDACKSAGIFGIYWSTRTQYSRITLTVRGGNNNDQVTFIEQLQAQLGDELIRIGDKEVPEILLSTLREKGKTLAIAESCTGGLTAKMFTDLPGASDLFWGSCVTYSNDAKIKLLKLSNETIDKHGAVSNETALEMVEGVLHCSNADVACAITGIAGPGGGTPEKPVGTVWIAVKSRDKQPFSYKFQFTYNRDSIRKRAVFGAMIMVELYLTQSERLDSLDKWQYS